jgi:hypothetical protein
MAPRKIRPNQVFQVYCTILRLEYSEISLRVSVNKDSTEFTEGVLKFDQPGSRIMQMLVSVLLLSNKVHSYLKLCMNNIN